ncbi:hypothetical protein TNCV_1253281 [Trichonephila clavipes]|nr:hypothetical protein TNCV_1253281 [Trichonephila clavipes]
MTMPVVQSVNGLTEQRLLHRMDFASRRPTRVPMLNAHHQAARLAWAREHRNWRIENWKRVARSAETRF